MSAKSDFTIAQTKEIHKRIKLYIGKSKMRMNEFYKKSGITSALFSQYKTGKTATSYSSVGKMADAVGISIGELLDGITAEISDATAIDNPGSSISEKDIRLVRWFRSLSQEKQKAILTSQDAPKDVF